MALQEQVVEMRRMLPLQDIGIWAAETAAVGGALFVAHNLGLTETYVTLLQSLAQLNIASDIQQDLQNLTHNPEMLQPAAMGIGFIAGVVSDIIYSGETLVRLQGHVNLQGTGDAHITEDGVRERDRQCVDGRIGRGIQQTVEPGAGQMGGAFIVNQGIALAIHKLGGEGFLQDFLTGYYIGRTLPTALVSAGVTTYTALRTAVESYLMGQGPVRENQLPHDKRCGWSGTENVIKHWLKFSKGGEDMKANILDAWNRVDETVNTVIWEPFMNAITGPLSLWSYRIAPNFGRTPITASHTTTDHT